MTNTTGQPNSLRDALARFAELGYGLAPSDRELSGHAVIIKPENVLVYDEALPLERAVEILESLSKT